MVLVLVVMIALAGFGFVNTMSTGYEATKLTGDRMQVQQAMLSAETYVQQFVRLSPEEREALGGLERNEGLFRGVPLRASLAGTGETASAVPDDVWQFSVLAPSDLNGEAEDSLGETSIGGPNFGLHNESRKLSLAAVLAWELRRPGTGFQALMRLPGMTPRIADAILDWMDPDPFPRPYGCENEYYGSLPSPYRTANRLPSSLAELLMVRGVTRELLFGGDANRNFRIDADEQQPIVTADESSSEQNAEFVPWVRLLTLHSAERNANGVGLQRVNLNNSKLAELNEQLEQVVTPELARFAILYRQFGPSSGTEGVPPTNVALDFANPARFPITSPADLVDISVTVPGEPSVRVQSPLQTGTDLVETLSALLDETSPVGHRVLRARLNINTASPIVVRALPFLSEETAEQLLIRRETLDETASRSVVWLLTENILDRETFRLLEPWITAGGDVFECQLVVFRGSGGPIRRTRVVFDGASPEPRRVECENLMSLGRGFSMRTLLRATEATLETNLQ